MSAFLVVLLVIIAANGVLLAVLSRQFGTGGVSASGAVAPQRIHNYQPMRRLLDPEELRFLRSQPGFTRGMENELRRQRATLFCLYLASLEADFRDACEALKLAIIHSAIDRADLAGLVMQQQVRFRYRVSVLRVQVLLYRCGIGNVEISRVFQPFEILRERLERIGPVAQPSIG